MKKICLTIFMFLSFVMMSHATTVLYRVSSGEVKEISFEDRVFTGFNAPYFGVLTDPPFTDGIDLQDPSGNMRVLGYAKINDNGTVRNATQEEIDTFGPLQTDDRNEEKAQRALNQFLHDPNFRMIVAAIIKGIIKEDNENRSWIRDFKDAVAASTSLADFQSRVAALDTPVNREFQVAKDYIISQVSKDD